MICIECKGSGKYVGLNSVETCKACKGLGKQEDPRTTYVKEIMEAFTKAFCRPPEDPRKDAQ